MSGEMASTYADVLPYVKAWLAAGDPDPGPCFELSAEESPVSDPHVGQLFVAYVLDEGTEFRLITEGERKAAGVSKETLRKTALANLSRAVEERGVELRPLDNSVMLVFDGNLEATLMLCDEVWPHLHDRLGVELFAVAPSRDVLVVSSPYGVDELRDVIARVWRGGDHLLTRDVYRRSNGRWSLHHPS